MRWFRELPEKARVRFRLPSLAAVKTCLEETWKKLHLAWHDAHSPLWVAPACILGAYYQFYYHISVIDAAASRGDLDKASLQLALIALASIYDGLYAFKLVSTQLRTPGKGKTLPETHGYSVREDDTFTRVREIPDRFLDTDYTSGLSKDDARARLEAWGPNELPQEPGVRRLIYEECSMPWSVSLMVAVVNAGSKRQWLHTVLALLAWAMTLRVQLHLKEARYEVTREHAWDAAQAALVLRDAEFSPVAAREIVPGDIVHVSEGLCTPADCTVVGRESIVYIDETAERGIDSRPPARGCGDRCFLGEKIDRGDALLLVLRTGRSTEDGRLVTASLQPCILSTSFSAQLRAFGVLVCLLLSTHAATVMLPQFGRSWIDHAKLVVTIAMALGILHPGKNDEVYSTVDAAAMTEAHLVEGAKVDRGHSVQVLAGVDMVCVDKLDIITDSTRLILDPVCFDCSEEELVLAALLTLNPDTKEHGSTDVAISKLLKRWPQVKARIARQKQLDQGVGQSSHRERLCIRRTVYDIRQELYREQPESRRECQWLRQTESACRQRGQDTRAILRERPEGGWQLLGIIPILDKPRYDSSFGVRLAQELGVAVKMFTQESKAISEVTAHRIGLRNGTLTAKRALSASSLATGLPDAIAECSMQDQRAIIHHAREKLGLKVAVVAEDPLLLEAVEYGIAPAHTTSRAAASAHASLLYNSLAIVMNAIKIARARLQVQQNGFVRAVAALVPLLLISSWHLVTTGEVLDLRVWFAGQLLDQLLNALDSLYLKLPAAEIEILKRPTKWESPSPLREAFTMVVVVTLGGLAAGEAITPSSVVSSTEDLLAIRSQCVCLYLLLVFYGTYILLRTGTTFWRRPLARRCLAVLACLDLVITGVCAAGWLVVDTPLPLIVCAQSWVIGILTLASLWSLRRWLRQDARMVLDDLVPMWPKYRRPVEHL